MSTPIDCIARRMKGAARLEVCPHMTNAICTRCAMLVDALDVLAEFCEDVEAAGIIMTKFKWPDLGITYDRATALFRKGAP